MMRQQRRSGLRFCIPGYRWCGPGCSGPGRPTNSVDACCKLHDECIRRNRQIKFCDQQFTKCLQPKINTHSKMGRDATLFYRFFQFRNKFN